MAASFRGGVNRMIHLLLAGQSFTEDLHIG